jgi:hypothetical protein
MAECRSELEGNTSAERVKQIKAVGISGHEVCCQFPHSLSWTWLKLNKGYESLVVLHKHYFLLKLWSCVLQHHILLHVGADVSQQHMPPSSG